MENKSKLITYRDEKELANIERAIEIGKEIEREKRETEVISDKHDIFTFYEWLNERRQHGSAQTILNLMNEYLLDYDAYIEWQKRGSKENAINSNR